MQIEKDNLRIRKLEINTDPFLSEFERQIEILPPNLKFIKKYIYLNFLPKIDKLIDDLEKIKLTPNYEEKITKIKPQSVQKVGTIITCIDTFETHNIEHMKTSKLVYGTSNGSLAIYDYENGKILLEKSIGKNRIEFLSTVTVKYFDTYCSRIAVNLRADPNIHFYYYNHSFSVIVFEASINLKDGLQSDPNTSLSSLVSGIKFSKDSFFVAIQDWEGGLRVYKFSDIPREMNNTNNTTSFKDQAAVPKRESVMMLNFQQKSDKKNSVVENQNNPTNTNSSYSLPVFVTQIRYKEAENYTILNPPKKEEDTKNKKEPPKNLNQKQTVKPAAGKEIKPQNILPDEVVYNITPDIDENGNDFTPFQKYSKNNSFFTFVQKKFIFEEKQTGGFTSCLLTVGFYVAFYNTNEMKFISLYSHLTDNMKNSFKVIKTKGGGILSSEESMSLTTLMAKKEKEYINFIKSKLENFTTGLNQINSALKNPKNDKEGKDTKEPSQNTQNNLDLLTKSEIVFTTLFPITILCGQKLFNNQNNLLAIGMTDGSISIWDAELHIDKFFFQDQFSPIVSLSLDENYLVAGGLDGLVHVYDLIEGKSIHKCFHNPFNNYPIQSILPFFPFMSMILDSNEKLSLYHNKEKEKCGKILLESMGKNYKISYYNKFLFSYNEEYIILVCNKDKRPKNKHSLLDFIKFQKIEKKDILPEFQKMQNDYINYFQTLPRDKKNKTYLLMFKIKELIVKCYPELAIVQKKGYSLKKIMEKYDMNNIPNFQKEKNSPKIDDKRHSNRFSTSSLNPVDERHELSIIKKDSCAKISENSINEDDLRNMKINLDTNRHEDEDNDFIKGRKGAAKQQSTQKKSINYYCFKNIRERYQYKEQRMTKIQMRNEQIIKSLVEQSKKVNGQTLNKNK